MPTGRPPHSPKDPCRGAHQPLQRIQSVLAATSYTNAIATILENCWSQATGAFHWRRSNRSIELRNPWLRDRATARPEPGARDRAASLEAFVRTPKPAVPGWQE